MGIIQAEDNIELIDNQVAEKLTTYIELELLHANLFYFWILLGSNLVFMLLTALFLANFYEI